MTAATKPRNHAPRCACPLCRPPTGPIVGPRPPTQRDAFKTEPPPPPPDPPAWAATHAYLGRLGAARERAHKDPRVKRLLELRRQGLTLEEAFEKVDQEFQGKDRP